MASDAQIALIQAWARDIDHSVDITKRPKAEFARLAKAKGWVGGDSIWCSHWEECFMETYAYGLQNRSPNTNKTKNLVDGRICPEIATRRLSITSDESSFSIISRLSRTNSFDSVRSLDSEGSSAEQSATEDVPHIEPKSASGLETAEHDGFIEMVRELSPDDVTTEIDSNPAWAEYAGFVHSPAATFRSEFERLARVKCWSKQVKREHFVSLLSSEVAHYWSADGDKLEQYQDMCRDLGLTLIPGTVTQCRKALGSLRVNLYSMIDNKRNPDIKIVQHESLSKLRKSIRQGGCFPREAAKAGGRCFSSLLCVL